MAEMNETKPRILGICKEPELLQGMGIDWRMYIPAGGFEWQEKFNDTYLPMLNEMIEKSQRNKYHVLQRTVRYQDALKGLGQAKKQLAALKEFLSGDDEAWAYMKNGAVEKAMEYINWINSAPEIAEKIETRMKLIKMDDALIKMYDKDIEWCTAFRDYILCDRELDMLMDAQHTAPFKYRTKIFRTTLKLAKEQEARRIIVESDNYVTHDMMGCIFTTPIQQLHKMYDGMLKLLRMEKKMLEKNGEMFWSTDPVEDIKLRQEIRAGAGTWLVVPVPNEEKSAAA